MDKRIERIAEMGYEIRTKQATIARLQAEVAAMEAQQLRRMAAVTAEIEMENAIRRAAS